MFTDHFDGKSLKRRPTAWLTAAHQDARAKAEGCRRDGATAHFNMWIAKATKYAGELDRREGAA